MTPSEHLLTLLSNRRDRPADLVLEQVHDGRVEGVVYAEANVPMAVGRVTDALLTALERGVANSADYPCESAVAPLLAACRYYRSRGVTLATVLQFLSCCGRAYAAAIVDELPPDVTHQARDLVQSFLDAVATACSTDWADRPADEVTRELRSANRRLADRDERYQALFDNMLHGFAELEAITDARGRTVDFEVTAANAAALTMLSLPASSLDGRLSAIHDGLLRGWIGELDRVLHTGKQLRREHYSETLGRWFSLLVYRSQKGHLAVMLDDISDRRRAEAQLRGSEERFRALYEASEIGIAILSREMNLIQANDALLRLLGLSSMAPLIGRALVDEPFLSAEAREQLLRHGHVSCSATFDFDAAPAPQFASSTRRGRASLQVLVTRIASEEHGAGAGYMVQMQDVTALHRSQERQHRLIAGQRAVVETASDLAACSSIAEVYRRAVDLAVNRIGLERCALLLLQDGMVQGTYAATAEGEVVDCSTFLEPLDGAWAERFRRRAADEPTWEISHLPYPMCPEQPGVEPDAGWQVLAQLAAEGEPSALLTCDATGGGAGPDDLQRELLILYASLLEQILGIKRAEERLTTSLERYRGLYSAMPGGVLVRDRQERITEANEVALRLLGITREQMERDPAADYGNPVLREDGSPMPTQELPSVVALRTGRPLHSVVVGVDDPETGTRQWLLASAEPVFSRNDPQPIASMATFVDITRQRRAESAARESEQVALAMLNATDDIALLMDTDLRVLGANEGFTRWTGVAAAEAQGRCAKEFVSPEAMKERMPHVQRALDTGKRQRWEERGPRGSFIHYAHPVMDDSGRPSALAVFSHDITERVQAEERLRQSEELYRGLAEAAHDMIFVIDRDDAVVYVNSYAAAQLGATAAELEGQRRERLFPSPTAERQAHFIDQVFATGQPTFSESLAQFGDHQLWIETRLVPIRDATGHVGSVLGVSRDITSRREAEQRLRQSEASAWALLNATTDMAMLLDTRWRVLGINEACAEAYGKSVEDLVGTVIFDHMDPAAAAVGRAKGAEMLRTGAPMRYEEHDGQRSYLTSFYPVADADGEITRVASFITETTDQRKAEASQRLAAVGQLAAGVAHEFNNILAGMMATAEMAEAIGSEAEYRRLVRAVLTSTAHGAAICRSLTAFARPKPPQRRPMYAEDAIDAALSLAGAQIEKAGVEVRLRYQPAPHCVHGDPALLEQVFLNVIINASHAMPGGGLLTLTTEFAPAGRGPGHVVVTVTDSGVGISPADLPRVFEPFFTTKGLLGESDTPGTGLGLSVSHGILAAHSGSIAIDSEEGIGTTVTITLPALSDRAAESEAQDRPATLHMNSATGAGRSVLVATDEVDLERAMRGLLERHGYTVVGVHDTRQAVEAMAAVTFDMIVSDLIMPGGGGRRIIEAAAALPTAPPVVIMTGRVEQHLLEDLRSAGAVCCLQKPFPLSEILTTALRVISSADG